MLNIFIACPIRGLRKIEAVPLTTRTPKDFWALFKSQWLDAKAACLSQWGTQAKSALIRSICLAGRWWINLFVTSSPFTRLLEAFFETPIANTLSIKRL